MKLLLPFPTAVWPTAPRSTEFWAVAAVLGAIFGVALLRLAGADCVEPAALGGMAEALRHVAGNAF